MTNYDSSIVENMIRNYFTLKETDLTEYADLRMDLQTGLEKLREESYDTYKTLMGVFAFGNSIQIQAELDGITKMQVHRRLASGLWFVTLVMNGVFV